MFAVCRAGKGFRAFHNSYSNEEERKLRVFENRVLRRIFGPRRDEVTAEWRRLYNEELNDLYTSPNIVRVIKSRRMRWAGHVARMGEARGVYRILVGKPEGKSHWGDLGVDRWIILGRISIIWDVGIWTGLGWPRIDKVADACECGNEHSGPVKCGGFLD